MNYLEKGIIEDLKETVGKWNELEKSLKLYTQKKRKYPFASINELRYAGRMVVECLAIILDNNKDKLEELEEKDKKALYNKMSVANQYFVNAAHDLIDIVCYELNRNHQIFKSYYGNNDIDSEYTAQKKRLDGINSDIQASRENRSEREKIYENLVTQELEFCFKFEDYLVEKIKSAGEDGKSKRKHRISKTVIFSFLAGVLASFLSGAIFFFLDLLV